MVSGNQFLQCTYKNHYGNGAPAMFHFLYCPKLNAVILVHTKVYTTAYLQLTHSAVPKRDDSFRFCRPLKGKVGVASYLVIWAIQCLVTYMQQQIECRSNSNSGCIRVLNPRNYYRLGQFIFGSKCTNSPMFKVKQFWYRCSMQIYTVKLQWKRDTCKKCTLYKYLPYTYSPMQKLQ